MKTIFVEGEWKGREGRVGDDMMSLRLPGREKKWSTTVQEIHRGKVVKLSVTHRDTIRM